jgi:hypothetical protein
MTLDLIFVSAQVGRTIKVFGSGPFSSFDPCLMKVLGDLMLSFTKKCLCPRRLTRDELRNKDSIVSILFSRVCDSIIYNFGFQHYWHYDTSLPNVPSSPLYPPPKPTQQNHDQVCIASIRCYANPSRSCSSDFNSSNSLEPRLSSPTSSSVKLAGGVGPRPKSIIEFASECPALRE